MENINQLYNEYNNLTNSIKSEEDLAKKQELQNQLRELESKLKDELKKEHEQGNNSPEFIQIYSKFDSNISMNSTDIESNVLEEKKEQEEIYTLASTKIISKYTGEEIDLSNMTRIDKIKTIYDHTGIEIGVQDPELLKLCDIRFQEFLRGCNPSIYEQKYGEKWQEAVEQIYKTSYLETAQRCIATGLNEVDEKNRAREKVLTDELEKSEQEKEQLVSEINELQEEVNALTEQVAEIKQERKEDLEEYKKVVEGLQNGTSVLHYDGTGMQERINDATHVHAPFTQEEKDKLQQTYDEVFGAQPISDEVIEEDKPKSM